MGIESIVDFDIPKEARIVMEPLDGLTSDFFTEMKRSYDIKAHFFVEFAAALRYVYYNAYDSVLIKRHKSDKNYRGNIKMSLKEENGSVQH